LTDTGDHPPMLHVIVHARPDGSLRPAGLTQFGQSWPCLRLASPALTRPLPVDFESAAEALCELPRLCFEPDGSFVWVGKREGSDWQIDGQLHDTAAGLMTVELKIKGPGADLSMLLRCLGWPQALLLFQLVREGVYVELAELLELLATMSGVRNDLPT
jgi:hypothetical protein